MIQKVYALAQGKIRADNADALSTQEVLTNHLPTNSHYLYSIPIAPMSCICDLSFTCMYVCMYVYDFRCYYQVIYMVVY
jgi:hypothetical protein